MFWRLEEGGFNISEVARGEEISLPPFQAPDRRPASERPLSNRETMKLGVKHYFTGLALLFISTLFVPQAVSDFARAESTGTPAPPEAPVLLAIGLLIILAAAAIAGRGYYLAHRNGVAPKPNHEDDPDEPLLRPGYGPATDDQDAWKDHPLRRPDPDGRG